MRIMPGGALEQEGPSSYYVGRKLDQHRGAFLLQYPMDKGYVTDDGWDAMEKVWEVSFLFSCCVHLLENSKEVFHPKLKMVLHYLYCCEACILKRKSKRQSRRTPSLDD